MDFLLSSGRSKSWMIGHTTVTITTSGSLLGPDGVCKNCSSLREQMFPQETKTEGPQKGAEQPRDQKQASPDRPSTSSPTPAPGRGLEKSRSPVAEQRLVTNTGAPQGRHSLGCVKTGPSDQNRRRSFRIARTKACPSASFSPNPSPIPRMLRDSNPNILNDSEEKVLPKSF